MGKLIISEEEKKRILNMHHTTKMKPFLFEEGEPVQPTTSTTPPTQPTPNPEPAPSTTLPENPTPQNPLMIRFYDVENGKRKENSYTQLDVYSVEPEDYGYSFRYSDPKLSYEMRDGGGTEKGNGRFYCDRKIAEIMDRDDNLIWGDSNRQKFKTFSDVVMKYWDNKCSKYVMNKNQTTNTGETTA
jgi:hypothetical protein